MTRDAVTQEELEAFVSQIHQMREEGLIKPPLPAVTISRSAGSRGELTAHALKNYLDATEDTGLPWKVFESNLVGILLKRNKLPESLAVRLPEEKIGFLTRIKGLFDKQPSNMLLFQKATIFLQELLGLGHTIIVGRGAGVLANDMPHVLKVRLLASKDTAIRRIAKDDRVSRAKAEVIRTVRDAGREAYIKNYHHWGGFHNVQEKHDLVIQTDQWRVVEVAEQIGRELRKKMKDIPT